MFPVTRPVLPDLGKYEKYLRKAHDRAWLTNFGPLHEELTDRLKAHLGVENLLLVANGTLALQVAYRALDLKGEILTTPFSFIATTSSLAWEGLTPRFVDVDPKSCNLDPALLGDTEEGSAIVAVHVYGNPCDVEAIEAIGRSRRMQVIYDAAHAFATRLDGRSVLNWGDASTLSFHATKLFHTVEGGAIIFRDGAHYERARALINFGLEPSGGVGPVGTNAKLSEYHAAAGLVLLDSIDEIISHRQELAQVYRTSLNGWVDVQLWHPQSEEVGAYMPIFLESEAQCLSLSQALAREEIGTRRYFHPALNRVLPESAGGPCPNAEDLAARVLCLPIYADLSTREAGMVAERVKACLS